MSGDGLDFDLSGAAAGAAAGNGSRAVGGASPIADLSYRTYDGPLLTRRARWWIVALNGVRLSRKKVGFWIAAAVSVLPVLLVLIKVQITSGPLVPPGADPFAVTTVGQRYASYLFEAYSRQAFMLFIIALLVGSGSIALDNRSNALQVYLSKPVTKGDYIAGKWFGIFLVIFAVAFVPSLIFYLYCLMTFWSSGILKQEPWLFVRMAGACAVPAAIHASLLLGFSAWSKTPRMAGATYAGLYFLGWTIAKATTVLIFFGVTSSTSIVQFLSVDGLVQGLGQNVFSVDLRFPMINTVTRRVDITTIPPPSVWILSAVAIGVCAVAIIAARLRIRAVEVVNG